MFHNQRAKETLPGSPSYVSRLEKESDSDYYSRLTPSPRLLDVPMSLNNLLSRYIYLDYRKSKNELVFRCFDVMNWLLPEQFYQHIAMIIDLMARYGLSTLPGIKTSIIFYCFSESSKTRYSDMFKLDTARIMKVYSKSPYVRMRDDVLNASNWSISFVSLDVSNYFHDIPYGYTKMSKKA